MNAMDVVKTIMVAAVRADQWTEATTHAVGRLLPDPYDPTRDRWAWCVLVAAEHGQKGGDVVATAERLALYVKTHQERFGSAPELHHVLAGDARP